MVATPALSIERRVVFLLKNNDNLLEIWIDLTSEFTPSGPVSNKSERGMNKQPFSDVFSIEGGRI